jgi:hypothetical protein
MATNFRPSDDLHRRLRDQAAAEGTSVQSLLVKAAEEYLQRHTKRALLDAAMKRITVEYADALRRLGE